MALAIVAGSEVANSMVNPELCDLHDVSEEGGPIRTSAGLMLETEVFTDKLFGILVVGGATTIAPSTPGVIAFLRAYGQQPQVLRGNARLGAIAIADMADEAAVAV